MLKVVFSSADSLATIIEKVRGIDAAQLELKIPPDNIFWQTPANKRLLEKVAAAAQKNLIWQDSLKGEEPALPKETSIKDSIQPAVAPPVKTKKKNRRRISFTKVTLIFFLFFIVFAAAGLAFVYYYLPRATVVLTVEEKTLERQEMVSLQPDLKKPEFAEGKLPAKTLSVKESEEETFAATGKKTVGDKATGTVSVQNWTDEAATFPKGTILIVTSDQKGKGLKFVTVERAVVPAQVFTTPEPGKKLYEAGVTNVQIEANKFGEEYNLAANTELAVADWSVDTFSASNTKVLSGGSTREVTIVAADDLTRSAKQLSSKLFAQAKIDLKSKVVGDQTIVEDLLEESVTNQTASAKAGEETDKFTIKTATQTSVLAYSESELKAMVLQKLKDLVPEGYKISTDERVISVQAAKKSESGAIELTVKVKTLVIPDFDLASLKKNLLGKRPKQAVGEILKNKQVLDYKIKTWPLLPKVLQTLPYRFDRLTIKVEAR